MDEYKEMYYKLFNKITDVVSELEAIQQESEEIILSQERTLKVIWISSENENDDS